MSDRFDLSTLELRTDLDPQDPFFVIYSTLIDAGVVMEKLTSFKGFPLLQTRPKIFDIDMESLERPTLEELKSELQKFYRICRLEFDNWIRSNAPARRRTDDIAITWLHLNMMAVVVRSVTYLLADKPQFDLPYRDLTSLRIASPFEFDLTRLKTVLGARMYWIQCRRENAQELYPSEGRYKILELNEEFLRGNLEQRYQYLLDLPPPDTWHTEWEFFTGLVKILTVSRRVIPENMRRIYEVIKTAALRQNRPLHPPLEDFTTDATHEAVNPEDTACSICYYEFGPEYSDDSMTEPAVKLPCGHMIGKQCLQAWITEEKSTCPMCRRELFSKFFLLPPGAFEFYQATMYAHDESYKFDERIDKYLEESFQETYDLDFMEVLCRITSLVRTQVENTDKLLKSLGNFLGLSRDNVARLVAADVPGIDV